jgi:hypothetical protein
MRATEQCMTIKGIVQKISWNLLDIEGQDVKKSID